MYLTWGTRGSMIGTGNTSLFFNHISIMVADRNESNSIAELESITVCDAIDKWVSEKPR